MNLYRVIWRWHFYVGLILAPVLIISAATGLIYIFKQDVRDALNANAVFLPSSHPPPMDAETLLAKLQTQQGKVEKFLLPAQPERSWIFKFGDKPKPPKPPKKPKPDHDQTSQHPKPEHTAKHDPNDKKHSHDQGKEGWHVDPATATLLGPVLKEPAFFKIVLDIHRRLLSGTLGRIVIELATSWAIVLMLTGLYLWWPKKATGSGVWWPRLSGKWYVVFRDGHAVAGFYLLVPLMFILITGLFFSYVWGGTYKWFQGKDPKGFFEVPKTLPSNPGAVSAGDLNEFIDHARSRWPGFDLEVNLPKKKEGLWTIVPQTSRGPKRQGLMVYDPVSRRVVVERDLSELSWMTQLRLWAYPIHTGSIWGWPSKILAALSCLVLIGLSASGMAMWCLRRKKGTLGLPRRPEVPLPYWLLAVIVLLAIALPVMGLSLVVIVLLDFVLSRLYGQGVNAEPPTPSAGHAESSAAV